QTTWTKIGEYDPPIDDEFSGYWAYGRSSDASSLGGSTYYVRFTSYNGPHTAKIRYLRLSATYTMPASGAPVDVTFAWNNGVPQTNTHTVAAGAASDSWSISTGALVSQTKVVMSVPSGAAVPTAPSISTQPANQTVTAGNTATFSVTAGGTAPLQYQWYKNNTLIAGATSSSYTTPATTLGDSGSTFKVVVTNGQGSVTSTSATLTVNPSGGGTPTTVTLQQGTGGYSGQIDTYIDQFQPTSTFGTVD